MKNHKAFTLAEVLVAMVIVGVLASAAIPSYVIHMERVRSSEGVQSLTALLAAQQRFRLESPVGAYAAALANLDITIAASNNFAVPTVANNPLAVASIQRANAPTIPYVLSINGTGTVACGCAGCNPANICTQIGY